MLYPQNGDRIEAIEILRRRCHPVYYARPRNARQLVLDRPMVVSVSAVSRTLRAGVGGGAGLLLDSRLHQRVVAAVAGGVVVAGLRGGGGGRRQLGEVLHVAVDGCWGGGVGVGGGGGGRAEGSVARRRRLHAQFVHVVPDQPGRTAHQMQHLQS